MKDGHFRGIVHCHSTRSFDGELSYAALKAFLGGKGLQFACMTEHIEELDQEKVDAIIRECRAASDADFLFVPGIEMDCFTIYFLGVEAGPVDFTSNRTIFDSFYPRASMCVFSHPIKAQFDYPGWLVEICDGVEILNTKHDGQHYFRPQSERLLREVRRTRPQAVGLAGMDFHGVSNYTPFCLRLTRKGPLEERFVLESLKAGSFEVLKNGSRLADASFLDRNVGRARIRLMDVAHATNKALATRGMRVPRSIRKVLRRTFEGS